MLTEAGFAALRQAEQIFQLGEQLPALVRDALGTPVARLAVGISDHLSKFVVRQLLEQVMGEPNLRLRCYEHEYEHLLADLALHRIDVVLADSAPPPNPSLRLFSHSLGSPALAWYAPKALYAVASKGFPKSLASVPVLLPTTHAAVRVRLDSWLERHAIAPLVTGEFEDSALMATFGAGGMGVFPASELARKEMATHYGVKWLGLCDGVQEHLFAIGPQRKVVHPLVQRLLTRQP